MEANAMHLHEAVRVIELCSDLFGSVEKSLAWFQHAELPVFDGNTPHELVSDDRTNDLVRYLFAGSRIFGMILTSLETVAYRVHVPRWSFDPVSGAGAARFGGRLNRPGVPALYLSLETATPRWPNTSSLLRSCRRA
jgi:hypothetical protein